MHSLADFYPQKQIIGAFENKLKSSYLKEAFFLKIYSSFWTSKESIFLENSSQSIEGTCVSHQYERSSVKTNRIWEFVNAQGFFQGNPSETSTNSSANYQQHGNGQMQSQRQISPSGKLIATQQSFRSLFQNLQCSTPHTSFHIFVNIWHNLWYG